MISIAVIVRRLRIASALARLCLLFTAASFAHAQLIPTYPPLPSGSGPPPKIVARYPRNASLPPVVSIPVGPLGFSVPGDYYLLRRQSLVSLDFLDEDRILFTFRVSGLIQRNAAGKTEGEQQKIQALVLTLPSGKVESRSEWVVPDRSRYLWMLNDGHFLLRVPAGLDEGDAQLKLTSNLRLPGRLLWIEMDPSQQLLIANSMEPAAQSAAESATEAQQPGLPAANPPIAPADAQKPAVQAVDQDVLVARTLKRASGDVIHVTRMPFTSQTFDWPLNSDGYLESVHGSGNLWFLLLKDFAGRDRVLERVQSTCPPAYTYTSVSELLVTTCDPENGSMLQALSTQGNSLWERRTASNAIWPLLVMAPNGSRLARQTMLLKRPVERYKHLLDAKDFDGQVVTVFDVASGRILLESPLTPMLDGGGNVAISPSGQRVAILNAGAIQVFQLPPTPNPPQPALH
ncbi:MAG: hypothetical protein WBC92_08015 [Terracidiphilus sp.]